MVLTRRTAGGYRVLDMHTPSPTIKPISPNGGAPRFDDLVWVETDLPAGSVIPTNEVSSVNRETA